MAASYDNSTTVSTVRVILVFFLNQDKSRHSRSNFRKSNSIELNPWIEFD